MTADEALDQLTATPTAPLARTGKPHIGKVRYTHEDCIDRILAEPGISQNTLAEIYGYSPGWVSVVVNSDAFKSALAARRDELVDPVLRATIEERFRAVTVRSLEVLQEKLARPIEAISDKFALEAAALGAKSLGLGVATAQVPTMNSSDHLANIAHRLIDLQARIRRPVVEVFEAEVRVA